MNGCVEVAFVDAQVAVRDSKDWLGPVLGFTTAEWSAFLAELCDGEFRTTLGNGRPGLPPCLVGSN